MLLINIIVVYLQNIWELLEMFLEMQYSKVPL